VGKLGGLQPPAILGMGRVEVQYFSSDSGDIPHLKARPPSLGITNWREY
jgi:hypothetical protein